MPTAAINRLLDQLDESKRRFEPDKDKRTAELLAGLSRTKFTDADSLIRFHEILLFLRAYPQNARILRLAESQLGTFAARVAALRNSGADLSPLDPPEVSGIAGTSVSDTFSYHIVHWLVRQQQGRVKLDWYWFEDENRLGEAWLRFMPLLEEDAFVEANVPYQAWLREAQSHSKKDLAWLVERFETLPITDREKAAAYNSQQLYVLWTPAYRATRTGMRLPARQVFYHRDPLIQRRDISFRDELEKPPPALKRLPSKQGETILNMARKASTIRYRELYGFTHGDPRRLLKASIGRGVDIFVMGVPPGKRLPLRAYHAAMIFKNGVPVGYFEGLSFFERMDSGFNLYYTFRDGETAWLYARTLNIFRHLLGVTAFVLDPYQIGYENEEGIESGAFWFYRKLGFRSTKPALRALTLKEEKKLRARRTYRSSARVLRKLAEGPMIFELDETRAGQWDRFQVRAIGLAVQRRMAEKFKGQAERIREESVRTIAKLLNIRITTWRQDELIALNDLALVMRLIPDLQRWTKDEKQLLVEIIRAKASSNEARYLKLMQRHARLRAAIMKLGS